MRTHLDPSELGTKQYWDSFYAREITNHTSNASDVGTIWFDDSGAEDKVLERLDLWSDEQEADKHVLRKTESDGRPASRILDLGTGNGHMLFALRDEGWEGELVGVDYSAESVTLARQIGAKRKEDQDEEEGEVRFETWDLLNQEPGEWLGEGFDAVLDKGTFDAISLSEETDAQGRRICETYKERVVPLVKKGGLFVITSCNWTKEEILHWFEGEELKFFDEGPYATFTYGGKTGSSVCTILFQRR
ncbi:hypothetical protein BT93_L1279 [Corymbia citriodora subsp. variegata]|uniref:Protein-lysine N-methyltransferase BT93_L1279 n=1 Tax=Corymbia citriodora subsp. variegata TaxID=360336 RepID=A0A8T0CEA2_CORYI|nr:hypothetical protein BT93_L1279 [Corymbia citriodora subsp. variegata]